MALGVYFTLFTLCAVFGTSVQLSNKCPDGWSNLDTKCYMFVKERVSWQEASVRCAERGGILAEPDTVQKIRYLLQISDDWIGWVGATDRRVEGIWVWGSSGTLVDPSLWLPSQPDSGFGNEDCSMVGNGGLYDAKCAWRYQYYCERRAYIPFCGTQH